MVEQNQVSPHQDGKALRFGILLLFGVLATAGGFLFLNAPWTDESYPLDDAWIHMVYARNLADGHGLCYNVPQAETGFTSPLWLFVMTGAQLATESVLAPKVIGLVFLVLLALVACRLGGIMAGLLIVLDPLMYFSALSGMEVILFSFLAILAVERTFNNRFAQAGIFVAAALVTRPEGALLCLLLPLVAVTSGSRSTNRIKAIAWLIVPALIMACAWILFCLQATGRPFPNTFYAKAGFVFSQEGAALPPMLSRFFHDLYMLLADAGPLFPLAAAIVVASACFGFRSRAAWIVFLLGLGLFVGTWCTRPVLRIEAFYWERYFIPALVCVHVLAGIVIQKFRHSTHRSGRISAGVVVFILVMILCCNVSEIRERYALNCRDIGRFNVAAGKWIAENTPRDAVVAVQDAGAIKYFGQRRTIDLGGLNDHTLTDLTALETRIDVTDPLALALHAGAEWVVIFSRHYSGRPGFEIKQVIMHEDYSIYITPERFTLMVLKKIEQKG